jgi:predicted nucleic acid-binding protein
LFERSKTLGAFDAILAAAAISAGAEAIVSSDRAFGEIRALAWWDPASRAVGEIVNKPPEI